MTRYRSATQGWFFKWVVPAGLMLWGGYLVYHLVRHTQLQTLEYERQQAQSAQLLAQQMAAIFRPDATLEDTYLACAELWRQLNPSIYQTPMALAWRRDSLDAYVFAGTDTTSVRHVRCDASGVQLGERYERPLLDRTPAEAVSDDQVRRPPWPNLPGDPRAETLSTDSHWHPSWHAVEAMHDPRTGDVLTRLWFGTELQSRTSATAGPDFPLLMQPSITSAVPALIKRVATRWNEQPTRAFALLARELPAGAKIVELTLKAEEIEVQIEGPIPGFDQDPPAPFGDKSFDGYGIAEASFWYPREIAGFGCVRGEPLSVIVERFRQAGGKDGANYHHAWYSCSSAYGDGRTGTWRLAQ